MSKIGKLNNIKTDFFDLSQATFVNDRYDENIGGLIANTSRNIQTLLTVDYINFNLYTHYEEFKELPTVAKGIDQENTSSTVQLKNIDELNLYKFSSRLEYNFLIKKFEENIISGSYSSLQIPNFYDVVQSSIETSEYLSFEGTSYLEKNDIFLTPQQTSSYVTNIFSSKLVLGGEEYTIEKYLKRFSNFKEQFPYFADIKFDVHEKQETNFSEVFDKYNLYEYVFNQLKLSSADNSTNKITLRSNNSDSKQYSYIDLNQDFINNLLANKPETNIDIFFDINNRISDKLHNFKKRKVLDILTGDGGVTYHEVIGYHIRKFENASIPVDGGRGNVLQEWYIPNTFEEKAELIDTQLIYGTRYAYSINPIVLAISYRCIASGNTFSAIPTIKIIDFNDIGPLYINRLLDYPPMEPEVEFIPFIGIANKIKINMNTSVGKKTVKPIAFNSLEQDIINKLKDSQDQIEDLLTFQSDEPSSFFEVYRIQTLPSSYEDFANSLLASISTQNSSGATIIDNITQNRKYYYVFKSVDYHKNVSNPTIVYEVEIINDNNLIIPYIKVVDFYKSDSEKDTFRSFKKSFKYPVYLPVSLFSS